MYDVLLETRDELFLYNDLDENKIHDLLPYFKDKMKEKSPKFMEEMLDMTMDELKSI